MAGASDKARFFLENSVPELRDCERKGIFSKDEITSIVKKRSGFEHTLNARGSRVSDYVRYLEYEMNLEALRRKRIKRLGIRSKGYHGQRRIFSIFNRGTQKFYGDVGLWLLYVDYTRKQKSYKRTGEVMTKMLRMHPNQSRLWIYAANYALEEKGDMMEARSLLQRGLRFCAQDEELWLQYGKLEMMFIAKIAGRRRILGLDNPPGLMRENGQGHGEPEEDVMILPSISADELNDVETSKRLANAGDDFREDRILLGALPIAVFDAAMKIFDDGVGFAIRFFDMAADFDGLPCRPALLNHVMDALRFQRLKYPATLIRYIKLPTIGVMTGDSSFPSGLGASLTRMQEISAIGLEAPIQADLYLQVLEWLVPYMKDSSLDQDLRQVLSITVPKVWRHFQTTLDPPLDNGPRLTALLRLLDEVGLEDLCKSGRLWLSQSLPGLLEASSSI